MPMKSPKNFGGLIAVLIFICMITWTGALPLPSIDHEHVGLRNKTTGNIVVWKCPECEPGMGLSVQCGEIFDSETVIECVPCKEGETFSDTRDIGQCKPCRICPAFEKKTGKCSFDQDTTQCFCKAGFYRDETRACAPCSWCCDDHKSNHVISECKGNPQGKHCSFQDRKDCAPTSKPTNSTDTITSLYVKISPKTKHEVLPSDKEKKDTPEYINKERSNNTKKLQDKHSGRNGLPTLSVALLIALPACVIVILGAILVPVAYRKGKQSSSGPAVRYGENVHFLPGNSAETGLAEILTEEGAERSQDSHAPGQPTVTEEERSGDDAPGQPTATREEIRDNDTQRQPPSDQHRLASESVDEINDSPWSIPDNPQEESSSQESKDDIQGPSELAAPRHLNMPRNGKDESEKRMKKELVHKTFGPKVEDMPHDVKHQVGLMLNFIQSISGNDYRAVASRVGLDYYKINNLTRESPMEEVFHVMISQAKTVNDFVDILYEIKRDEVVLKMYEMALHKSVRF